MNRRALLIAMLEAEMECQEAYESVMTEMENGQTREEEGLQENYGTLPVPNPAGVGEVSAPQATVGPVR